MESCLDHCRVQYGARCYHGEPVGACSTCFPEAAPARAVPVARQAAMTFRCSLVDLRGLPSSIGDYWHLRVIAMRDVHRAIDPHYDMRLAGYDAFLAPPRVSLHPLGGGLFVLLSLEVPDAAS